MLWQRQALHNKMTKVSPAQLNSLFLFSKLRAKLLLVSWLLMHVSFQKHNQLTFTSGLHTWLSWGPVLVSDYLYLPLLLSLLSRTQVLSQLLRLSCTLGFLRHFCSPLSPLDFLLDCSVCLYQLVTGDRCCRQVLWCSQSMQGQRCFFFLPLSIAEMPSR